jgi:hypothetical protein
MSTASESPSRAQEARRVLRKLAEHGTYLAPLGAKGYGLFVPRNQYCKPILKIDGPTFKTLASEGFVAPLPARGDGTARYGLSADGEAFLRRAAAPSDPCGAQHRLLGVRQIETRPKGESLRHVVNLAETPLGWLALRCGRDGKPFITMAQFQAGERLREDFTRAQIMRRMTVDWEMPLTHENVPGLEEVALKDTVLDARRRLSAALKAAGHDLASLLIDVCCYLKRLEDAERERNWPQRTAKIVLRIGLSRLAEHYGLDTRRDRARLRAWQASAEAEA